MRETQRLRSGMAIAIVFVVPFSILASLTGCATRKPASIPEATHALQVPQPPPTPPADRTARPEPAIVARIGAADPIGIDQNRLRIPLTINLANLRSKNVELESGDCVLSIEGASARTLKISGPISIAAGNSASIPLEFLVDTRELGEAIIGSSGPALANYSIEAKMSFTEGVGTGLSALATTSGTFPIIREPRLRILSLEIQRDILVTTKLRLLVEIENPNIFPVGLSSFAYDFYGEGKPWASGESASPFHIDGRSNAKLPLAFELNFVDRDRALLDLVAQLKVLRYRLTGMSKVSTDLDFLPEFRVGFDKEGSLQVEK